MTIRCIRNFAEVASNQNARDYDKSHTVKSPRGKKDKATSPTRREHAQKEVVATKGITFSSESNTSSSYGSSLLQLLDLLDVLYSKVGQIFDKKTIEGIGRALASESQSLQGDSRQATGRFGSVSESSMDSLRGGGGSVSSDYSLMWRMAWCPILQGDFLRDE